MSASATSSVAIISGLDPSGGAGFIADVRVVIEHGLRPVGVVTATTEQDSNGVRAIHPVKAEVIAAELTTLLSDIEVVAVKIGMLGNAEVARAVAGALALTGAPVVWDPVLLPTSGRVALYGDDPREARAILDDHLTLITPNLAEAAVLTGTPVANLAEMRAAARVLCGSEQAVLVKGGHLTDQPAIDVLAHAGAIVDLVGERVATGGPVHGTGCALSAAIACHLAHGEAIAAAVSAGKEYVAARLRRPVTPGRGMGFLA